MSLHVLPVVADCNKVSDADLTRYRRHLRAQGYAAPTIRAKVGIVDMVSRNAGVDPNDLEQQHVEEYFERRLAAWSRRKYLQHLRSYGEWAGIDGLVAGFKMPRAPKGVPRPCSENALGAMLAAAELRERTFIIFGAYAGMRSFEIAKARGEDLEQLDDGWRLRIVGKGGREDVLPVGGIFVRAFLDRRSESGMGPLFPSCTANAVQLAIRKTAEIAGVTCTAHMLRHRYGTQLYRLSRDLMLVQKLMRHSSPLTTIGYAELVDSEDRSLVDRLPWPAAESSDRDDAP
jgi:integrase/recombinase XerC